MGTVLPQIRVWLVLLVIRVSVKWHLLGEAVPLNLKQSLQAPGTLPLSHMPHLHDSRSSVPKPAHRSAQRPSDEGMDESCRALRGARYRDTTASPVWPTGDREVSRIGTRPSSLAVQSIRSKTEMIVPVDEFPRGTNSGVNT